MKKFLSILICITMLAPMTSILASADAISTTSPEDYLVTFLLTTHGENVQVNSTQDLFDASGYATFVCLRFSASGENGYAILDKTNNVVIELSFDQLPAFKETRDVIFAGPLVYYYDNGTTVSNVRSNETYSKSSIEITPEIKKVRQMYRVPQSVSSITNSVSTRAIHDIPGATNSGWYFEAGKSDLGDCGLNAAAMMMKWLDLYRDSSTLPATLSTEMSIKTSIADFCDANGYNWERIDESEMPSVLMDYSDSQNSIGYYSDTSYFDFNAVKYTVDNAQSTMIISTSTGTPTYGYHYVMLIGYNTAANQVWVNDGWGSRAYINTNYFTEMVQIG